MRPARLLAATVLVLWGSVPASAQVITTIAGGGPFGPLPAALAALGSPASVATDAAGNLYVACPPMHRVFRIDPSGQLTTVAGTGLPGLGSEGAPATDTPLNSPQGVTVDAAGNVLVADTSNNRVRRVDAVTGLTWTVAGGGQPADDLGDGGLATNARLYEPHGLALDGGGNLLIADQGHSRVRRVERATGVISTVAGTGDAWGALGDGGPAALASLAWPTDVAVDVAGNLFVADSSHFRIRRIDAASQVIETIAGDGTWGSAGDGGPATVAQLSGVRGLALEPGGSLLIADTDNQRVRRVDPVTGLIDTVAGSGAYSGVPGDGGPATEAVVAGPADVVAGGAGFWIAESGGTVSGGSRRAPSPRSAARAAHPTGEMAPCPATRRSGISPR